MARTRMVPIEDYNDMRADYEALRQENIDLRAGESAPKRRVNFSNLIIIGATIIALVFVVGTLAPELLYNYGVPADTIRALFRMPAPAAGEQPAPTAPQASPPPTSDYSRGGGAPLPPCSQVTDTRTACQADGSAPAQVEAMPTEAPVPTAPPYEAACVTLPNERPCWLPADAPWSPPEEVPATPLVLLAPTAQAWEGVPFVRDVCRDWRPPQVYPEECSNE